MDCILCVHMPELSHFRGSGKSCAKLFSAENSSEISHHSKMPINWGFFGRIFRIFFSQIISSSKMLFICFLLYHITRTKKKLRFFRVFFCYLGWFRHIILQFLPFRSFAFFAENSIYDFAFRGSQNMRKNGMCSWNELLPSMEKWKKYLLTQFYAILYGFKVHY